jgi:hypothetical protein
VDVENTAVCRALCFELTSFPNGGWWVISGGDGGWVVFQVAVGESGDIGIESRKEATGLHAENFSHRG